MHIPIHHHILSPLHSSLTLFAPRKVGAWKTPKLPMNTLMPTFQISVFRVSEHHLLGIFQANSLALHFPSVNSLDSKRSSRIKRNIQEYSFVPLTHTHLHSPKDIFSCLQCQACLSVPWKWITLRFPPQHSIRRMYQPIPHLSTPSPFLRGG